MPYRGRLIFAAGACFLIASCRHQVAAVAPATTVSGPVVLPSGTVLALIVAETIDSTQPAQNRTYAAVISRDIDHGQLQTILPSGSPATLVLMSAGTASSGWQLGLSSVMLNGDSFLMKNGSDAAVSLGTFLGGVPGPTYPDLSEGKRNEPTGLIVSESAMHILAGSLLTFRLEKEVTLVGSVHR